MRCVFGARRDVLEGSSARSLASATADAGKLSKPGGCGTHGAVGMLQQGDKVDQCRIAAQCGEGEDDRFPGIVHGELYGVVQQLGYFRGPRLPEP